MSNKMRAALVATLIAIGAAPSAHAIEIGELKQLIQQAKTDPDIVAMIDTYLAGLIEGMTVMNVVSNPTDRSYCPPPTLTLTKENARAFILNSPAVMANTADKFPASLVPLHELRRAFPCKP